LYDSLTPSGIYSQAFNGPEITEFGNAINLAPNPEGLPLGSVTVGMANFSTDTYTTDLRLTIYNVGPGGTVGTEITNSTSSDITVPNNDNAGNGVSTFNVTFSFGFTVPHATVVLPGTVVYGVQLLDLNSDCSTTPTECGNDLNPVGRLELALTPNVSAGSDVFPGDVYVQSLQADVSGTALAGTISQPELGGCRGAPTDILSTFQGVPVDCAAGYASNVEAPNLPGGLGVDSIPAVEFTTASS